MLDIFKEVGFKNYSLKNLTFPFLKYEKLWQVLDKSLSQKFEKQKISLSFEGRNLFLLKKGFGKTKILLWSQMHGNEPISTLALADVLNFLNDEKNIVAQTILQNTELSAIPMLNPDGAEKFRRRNAQEIDINRDALRLQTPEGKILEKTVNSLKPDFAFNLHDQEIFYGTDDSDLPTALAFLTPAFDYKRSIDQYRIKSMKVIASVVKNLQPHLNGRMAKYNDTFYPTAFGDNIQKKGIPVILIEGGFFEGNYDRTLTRKYYFYALVSALYNIANQSYENADIELYEKLPLNKKHKFVDILLKNIKTIQDGKVYTIDIALWTGNDDGEDFNFNNIKIKDLGDLRNFDAFRIYECDGLLIKIKQGDLQKGKKADFLLKLTENCRKVK